MHISNTRHPAVKSSISLPFGMPRSYFAKLTHLLIDDARSLLWPLLGWFALLSTVYWMRRDSLISLDSVPVGTTGAWNFAIQCAGWILAGMITLQHSIHQHAFWRTRPWPPTVVLSAKLFGILLWVWLPAAALQILMIQATGLESPPIRILGWELLIVFGIPLLVAGTVGSLSSSLRAFLVAGAVGFTVALTVARKLLGLTLDENPLSSGSESHSLLIGGLAFLIMATTYLAPSFRYWALFAAVVVLFLGWKFAADRPWLLPELSGISPYVTHVGPPAPDSRQSNTKQQSAICASFGIDNVAAQGSIILSVRSQFQATGVPEIPASIWAARLNRTGSTRAEHQKMPLFTLPQAFLQQYGQTKGTLKLDLSMLTSTRDTLAEGVLTPGSEQEISPSNAPGFRLQVSEPMPDGSIEARVREKPQISHMSRLTHYRFKIQLSEGAKQHYKDSESSALGGRLVSLPFPVHQISRIETLYSLARNNVGSEASLAAEEAAEPVNWSYRKSTIIDHRTFTTELKQVSLQDLVCLTDGPTPSRTAFEAYELRSGGRT